ncbi:MAG: FABP family protein [Acidimicrobiales bacterium]
MAELHQQLAPLGGLVGTWRGTGSGSYPTIDDFSYLEEVTFGHVGKPFLAYGQKTRDATTDLPLHAETGYWRVPGAGEIEVVIAHPTGIVEVLTGPLEDSSEHGTAIDLRTSAVAGTPTAKSVTELHRRFILDGDELHYEVAMAAVGHGLTHHLAATLRRVPV